MTSFSLTKQSKLLKTDDYSSVFNLRKRISGQFLVFRYKLNQLQMPRLGLIVAKKTAKRAVNRNYMRRVLREEFRLNQHVLPSVDLIIQVQKTFVKPDFFTIEKEFAYLLRKLNNKISLEMVDVNIMHASANQ